MACDYIVSRDMMEQFEAPALVGRAGSQEEEEETNSTHPSERKQLNK
jgi:hypothetical protein